MNSTGTLDLLGLTSDILALTAFLQDTSYGLTELAWYAAHEFHLTQLGIVAILANKMFDMVFTRIYSI